MGKVLSGAKPIMVIINILIQLMDVSQDITTYMYAHGTEECSGMELNQL